MADITVPSITGGVVERHPGGRLTCAVKAAQTVVGGNLVEVTAGFEVQKAAAESKKVLGVALYDADGDNDDKDHVTVATAGVWDLVASGAISAGALVASAGSGAAKALDAFYGTSPSDSVESADDLASVIGIAMEDISNGAAGAVLLRLGGTL